MPGLLRRCLPEELCRRLFQQLIMAVDYCHRLGIANRDIKVRAAQGDGASHASQMPAEQTLSHTLGAMLHLGLN